MNLTMGPRLEQRFSAALTEHLNDTNEEFRHLWEQLEDTAAKSGDEESLDAAIGIQYIVARKAYELGYAAATMQRQSRRANDSLNAFVDVMARAVAREAADAGYINAKRKTEPDSLLVVMYDGAAASGFERNIKGFLDGGR